MSRKILGVAAAVALSAGLAGLAWQYRTNAELQREVAQRRHLAAEKARLTLEQQRLQAAQISPAELAERQAARTTLAALASEIELTRRRANAEPVATVRGDRTQPPPSRLTLRDSALSAEQWTNAGDRAAVDALETALWASAHGDIETLNGLLIVSDAARARAAELFASLPPALRGQVSSPEQLVAVLTANAVPLGSAQVMGEYNEAPASAKLALHVIDADGNGRGLMLSLRQQEGHWRLVVPDAALAGYLKALQSPPAP